tara:strand:+ start:1331 stop:1807 length:477 start_codon:yes stop_codon:yes gene_type:complete
MNFYIETENGVTKNHPAFEDNLVQAFGVIPAHWEPFTRVERPVPNTYQVLGSNVAVYAKLDGVWTDVWDIREMTGEEKTAKQQAAKDAWAALPDRGNYTAWTFDEATCEMVPPTLSPNFEGYFWQGTTSSWVGKPAYPDDGKKYKIDYAAAAWVEVTG